MADRSCQHINDEVRFRGLNSNQLGLAVVSPLIAAVFHYLAVPVVLVIVLIAWKWYYGLMKSKESGALDYDPFATKNIERSTEGIISDSKGYYDQLLRK